MTTTIFWITNLKRYSTQLMLSSSAGNRYAFARNGFCRRRLRPTEKQAKNHMTVSKYTIVGICFKKTSQLPSRGMCKPSPCSIVIERFFHLVKIEKVVIMCLVFAKVQVPSLKIFTFANDQSFEVPMKASKQIQTMTSSRRGGQAAFF